MEQGYGGWSRRPSAGWGEQALPRVRHPEGAGWGLRPSAVTTVRPSREVAGARARRSLDCGAVSLIVLRADWPAAPEEVGRAQRANAAAGFGGRLGASGMFLPLGAGEAARPAERAGAGPFFPFRRRHKMAALGAEPRPELVGCEAFFPG